MSEGKTYCEIQTNSQRHGSLRGVFRVLSLCSRRVTVGHQLGQSLWAAWRKRTGQCGSSGGLQPFRCGQLHIGGRDCVKQHRPMGRRALVGIGEWIEFHGQRPWRQTEPMFMSAARSRQPAGSHQIAWPNGMALTGRRWALRASGLQAILSTLCSLATGRFMQPAVARP